MASSSSRKSSSSASRASKPTFRRAQTGSKPASAARPRATGRVAAPSPRTAPSRKPRVSSVSTKSAAARKARTVQPRPAPARPRPRVATQPAGQARPAAAPRTKAKARKIAVPRRVSGTRVAAVAPASQAAPARKGPALLSGVRGAIGRIAGALATGRAAVIALALVLVVVVGAVFIVNAPFFAASTIIVNGSEHVPQETAEQLVDVPSGTTLLNVDANGIASSLMSNPWVSGVDVTREFPHTLIITPRERSVAAIVYITTDDVAWALGEDGCWIAPVSLAVTVDAEGNIIDEVSSDAGDGTASADALPEGAQQLTGLDAARTLARHDGALLFTDVPADVAPSSGTEAASEIVQAGLAYATGFSDEFITQIDYISLSSVDAVTAYLTSGVEVALGAPENIETKERIVTRLLEQQQGVTYVNVRTPDAYTFRAAPTG